MPTGSGSKYVFINCPFDSQYKPLFDAIVFAVFDLGFVARCALEIDDASETRLLNIRNLIAKCRYGIHDISAVALSKSTKLPRFNMPLELGLFLGCKFFGGDSQKRKACLILDTEPYRYRASISDIAGQDIHAHHGQVDKAILEIRNWIVTVSKGKFLPGGAEISARYKQFTKDLPKMCKQLKRRPKDLTFVDYSEIVQVWLTARR